MGMGVRGGRYDTYMGETGGYDGEAVGKLNKVVLLKWGLWFEILDRLLIYRRKI
jgi:hypothetical protein